MRLLDLTLPTLAENLALDEALLLEADAGRGGEVLRWWEWRQPAVVLGAAGRLAEEVHEPACLADAVPIQRRASGGGTVLLDAGCLVYSLVLAYEREPALAHVGSSYRFILERTAQALRDRVAGLAPAGTSDLAIAGRKVSGSAQQRKRGFLLHHGTLLYAFDCARVGRYLRPPPRQPDYRQHRGHEAFLTNLPIPAEELKLRLTRVWQADRPADWPVERVRELVTTRYGTADWPRRR
jgi:lipoate-protein ligase A